MYCNQCERCHKEDVPLIMSIFNTQMICMDCKTKEENHPEYKRAEGADIQAIRSGNYNFKGIGKPKDL